MSTPYRIFGMELSPYSVKVRSYFRYKQIPHEWIVRSSRNMEEFTRHAKLPLIPLVLTPDGAAIQDSTPILEQLEVSFPEPSIHPSEPAARFISALLEEYGDEWGNKWMFHYRWTYAADAEAAARRIAEANMPDADADAVNAMAGAVEKRMVPRLSFVGSSEKTRDQIEASFREAVAFLEAHLADRSYLFGERPAFGDFGLYPQLYECAIDPTPAAHLKSEAPNVLAWIDRMLAPEARGDFEAWESLEPTLQPLLATEVAGRFLPWSTANARAIAAGEAEFSVDIDGRPFSQGPQKYHAKSLAALKARYAAAERSPALEAVLEASGCSAWLRDG